MPPKPKAQKRFEVKVPDPYKFLRTLGQGRFGSVHEVSKPPSDEHFAMKVLPFTCEADFKKNEHEFSKLRDIKHRNVVGFVEAIEGDNTHFVVLELCSHSLHDEMKECRDLGAKMDVVRVYRVMKDILGGLVYLHSRGQIYGDLKGPNVLIGKDGTAKLGCDFGGVVGVGTMKTSNPAECGTMQYWAPEFFKLTMQSDIQIGSSAGDMWAFGLLLLELLTSRSWIVGESSVEIERSVLGFDIDRICEREGIVGEEQTLFSLLLCKNPSQRISSAELIRSNRLQSILGPETPLSRFYAENLTTTRQQLQEAMQATAKEPEALLREQTLQTSKLQIQSLEKAHSSSNTLPAVPKVENQRPTFVDITQDGLLPTPSIKPSPQADSPNPKGGSQRPKSMTIHQNKPSPTPSVTPSPQADSPNPKGGSQRPKSMTIHQNKPSPTPSVKPSPKVEPPIPIPVNPKPNPVVVHLRNVPNPVQTATFTQASFNFTDPSHFRVDNNVITRTDVGRYPSGTPMFSSLFLADTFSDGVISVELTILSLKNGLGGMDFGLMDSNNPTPKLGDQLGGDRVNNSVSLSTSGSLNYNGPTFQSGRECHPRLKEGDRVRMEVDLNSKHRTLQFFVNDNSGQCYMSEIPSSVKIGFTVSKLEISFRIDKISRDFQPKPIPQGMKEVKW
ncbi:putative Cytokinesis protein sepH [Blattamonas nauphoetae]|uniref:Cytokinesis protein sepH n=1 Tax=Blattamonas nauphoetae TaxID=2049346 RepID=A0ABQ9XG01_9EUKA|nr:putative Cytokinesis protein sepH [Blattamonas nauphoetae]